jgi:hypothetical protein
MNSKKPENPKDRAALNAHGAQEPRRVVKLTRPPPRSEKTPAAAAKPKDAKSSAVYVRVGLALVLIAVLVIGVNQAMLFLMK